MRFLLILVLTAVASYFALMIMPWWIPMLIAFALILILPLKNGSAFLATGLGAAVCYALITFFTDQANEHILSGKMAQLFHLPSGTLMIVVTALIGFVTAGFGGWTAAALRRLLQPSKIKEQELAGEQHSS